jgi:hypothetical protein
VAVAVAAVVLVLLVTTMKLQGSQKFFFEDATAKP